MTPLSAFASRLEGGSSDAGGSSPTTPASSSLDPGARHQGPRQQSLSRFILHTPLPAPGEKQALMHTLV